MRKYLLFMLVFICLSLIIGCSNSNKGAVNLSPEDRIAIPLNEITETAQKYEFDAGGTLVRYFVVKASDGQIRTAFDACDVCGGSKGYIQQGQDIKCVNCGRVFSIDGLGTKNKGYGCWPSFLSHFIEEGNVIISKTELAQGKHRFV